MSNYFTTPFGEQTNELPVEAHRYRLIWAAPCPYASRAKITLDLLGLDPIISVGETHPINADIWHFGNDPEGVDPVLGAANLKDIYLNAEPNYVGPFSVPVLVDETNGQIVRQQSGEIVRDFATQFKAFHHPSTHLVKDLYPQAFAKEIDYHNHLIGDTLTSELFAIGTAETQVDYDIASDTFFNHLRKIDERLNEQRFYHTDTITETDIYLYVILVRFYIGHQHQLEATAHNLQDYTYLWNYLLDLHQIPAFGHNTKWEDIKQGMYLGKHGQATNRRLLVPQGPSIAPWNEALQNY